MGEKLKDLGCIELGDITLDIELNSGFSSKENRSIHMQNNVFRYEMLERDFIRVALLLLRSHDELNYIKKNKIKYSNEKKRHEYDLSPCLSRFPFIEKFKELSYRVVETRDSVITVLVNNSPDEVNNFMKNHEASEQIHPFSKIHGYKYIYLLEPFMLYIKDNLYYEIIFQLPCLSLTPKTWMPLDLEIQNYAWMNNREIDGINVLDDETLYIYRLINTIFYQNHFSEHDITFFEKNNELINMSSLRGLLSTVFFKYTERLFFLLKNKQYNDIVNDYFTYRNY